MLRRSRIRKPLLWQAAALEAPRSPEQWTHAHVKALLEDGFVPDARPRHLHEIKLASQAVSCYGTQITEHLPLDADGRPDWHIEQGSEGWQLRVQVLMVVAGQRWMQAEVCVPLSPDGSLDSTRPALHQMGAYHGALFSSHIHEMQHRLLQRLGCAGYTGQCEFALSPEQLMSWADSEDQLFEMQPVQAGEQLHAVLLGVLDQFVADTAWTHKGIARVREQIMQMQDVSLPGFMRVVRQGPTLFRGDLERWLEQGHPAGRLHLNSPPASVLADEIKSADDVPMAEWPLGAQIVEGWTIEEIQNLLSDEWRDETGRLWKTRPVSKEAMTKPVVVKKRRSDGSAVIMLDGDVLCHDGDGWEQAGDWRRQIEILPGGKIGPRIEHATLVLEDDYQRLGFARQWLARCSERYLRWGVEHIDVQTGLSAGARVWPRMGFKLSVDETQQRQNKMQLALILRRFKEYDMRHRDKAQHLAQMQEQEFVAMALPFERWTAQLEAAEVDPEIELDKLLAEMLTASAQWKSFYEQLLDYHIEDPFNQGLLALNHSVEGLRHHLGLSALTTASPMTAQPQPGVENSPTWALASLEAPPELDASGLLDVSAVEQARIDADKSSDLGVGA